MKMTRIISLLLALMMTVCCFAGCKEEPEEFSSYYTVTSEIIEEEGEDLVGGSTPTVSSKNEPTNSNSTFVPPTDKNIDDKNAKLPEIEIKNKKVTVCIDWDPKSDWVQRWEKAFKKAYPGISISYKQATPEMKASKLAVWANSGQSPDAVYVKPEESWPDLVNKNLVQPVDKYIDINTSFWGSIRNTMNSLKLNGNYYALTSCVSLYGSVIYNPKVMKAAGLADPESLLTSNQWTWKTFEAYAHKLTKLNATDPSKSTYGAHIRYGEVFLPTTGKDLIEYSNGKWVSNLNNNNIKTAIDFLKNIGPTGKKLTLTSAEEADATKIRKMTVSGQVGMYVTAEAASLEFPEEMKNGTLKWVPIPRSDKTSTYYTGGSVDAFYVPKGAKNPEGGVAYACAIRGYNIGIVEIKTEKIYTDAQLKIEEYALSKITAVPLQFRRLSGTVEYYNIYGPTYLSGDAYSGIVAEWEPKVIEALKKQ